MKNVHKPDPAELAWLQSMRRMYPMAVQAREVSNKPASKTLVRRVRDTAAGLLDEMAPRDEVLLQQLREQTGHASCRGDCRQGRDQCKTPEACSTKPEKDDASMWLSVFVGGVVVGLLSAAIVASYSLRGVL